MWVISINFVSFWLEILSFNEHDPFSNFFSPFRGHVRTDGLNGIGPDKDDKLSRIVQSKHAMNVKSWASSQLIVFCQKSELEAPISCQ